MAISRASRLNVGHSSEGSWINDFAACCPDFDSPVSVDGEIVDELLADGGEAGGAELVEEAFDGGAVEEVAGVEVFAGAPSGVEGAGHGGSGFTAAVICSGVGSGWM
jgi:hypothetical protein